MVRFLIAIVLLIHGAGHIMPFLAAWTTQKAGFSNATWIFSGGMTPGSPVGQAFGLLGLVALLGFFGSAIGLIMYQDWWPTMAVAATAISLVLIIPWWNAWPVSSLIGALLVDAAILVALVPPWGHQLVQAL